MVDRTAPLELARRAALPAACIVVMVYFGFHAVTGNTGLFAWQGYKIERAVADERAAEVRVEREVLVRQVALLDPRHVDPDYADELVRRNLGVVRPDEVIIPLPDSR